MRTSLSNAKNVCSVSRDVVAQFDAIDFFHQIAEHRALAAARRDGTFFHFFTRSAMPFFVIDGDRVYFPVHLNADRVLRYYFTER